MSVIEMLSPLGGYRPIATCFCGLTPAAMRFHGFAAAEVGKFRVVIQLPSDGHE